MRLSVPAIASTSTCICVVLFALAVQAQDAVPELQLAPPPARKNIAAVTQATQAARAADSTVLTVTPGGLKLREIEDRVNELKEKVFQAKARLVQLQEVILHGTLTSAKMLLVHRNEMGSSFKLAKIDYSLDGATIFSRDETNAQDLESKAEFEVFNGPVGPGTHQVAVDLEYTGNGFGVFNYIDGYRFKLKASYVFNAEEGKLSSIHIVGFEKGGFTTDLKDRPAVRFDVDPPQDLVPPASRAQAPTAPPAGKETPAVAAPHTDGLNQP